MLLRLMRGVRRAESARFQHVLEGYKVADETGRRRVGASAFSDWWAYKFEVYDAIPYNGSLMRDRGVLVSFNSDSSELARRLYLEAAKAVKYGGTPEDRGAQLRHAQPGPATAHRRLRRLARTGQGRGLRDLVEIAARFRHGLPADLDRGGKKYFDRSLNAERVARLKKEREDLLAKAKKIAEAVRDGEGRRPTRTRVVPSSAFRWSMNSTGWTGGAGLERRANDETCDWPSGQRSAEHRLGGMNRPCCFAPGRCSALPFAIGFWVALLLGAPPVSAETLLLKNAVVHTVAGSTLSPGEVLVADGKIVGVGKTVSAPRATEVDLKGRHLYPGLIALDTVLGLTEIEAVRATQDTTEVGDYTPEVESWIAINPDSELIPVTRANGIAYFEPVPEGGIVSGQSALLAMDGWTYEQMTIKKPLALHVFWPPMELNTTPKERAPDPAKWKSLEDQAKARRARLKGLDDFFEDAKAYNKAREAAARGQAPAPEKIPAWEAMLPYVRGELPIVIHADELRQIRSAVAWAGTNHFKIILAGGRDAAMVAGLLATNKIPVIFEHVFTLPARDTDAYDVQFSAPEVLRQAGVKVVFSVGPGSFIAPNARNLPYAAAQAVAFGLPEAEALKGITLYPAQLMGVADRLGSIEPGQGSDAVRL